MKKLIFLSVSLILLIGCSSTNSSVSTNTENKKEPIVSMINPWTDCGDDLVLASKIAGFTFPLILSNYWVRAMKGMIEVSYPLDEFRNVCVRKVETLLENQEDISGVYYNYPINKETTLPNGVPIKIRTDENKIYVMNMSASKGYYSAYCKEGMSMKEVYGVYKVIAEAEAPKIP